MALNLLKKIIYKYRLNRLQDYFASTELKKKPIVISGSPRGGTTWIFEVLQKTTKSFGIWEALHPKTLKEYYPNQNFKFHKYIALNQKQEEIETYLDNVTKGNYITSKLLQKNTRFKSYEEAEFLLLKFCRLSPMLPWWNKQNKGVKVLQLYRNPLAVVASQMKHGAWKTFSSKNIEVLFKSNNYQASFYYQFKDIITSIEHPEEVLAAVWALDMLPTLSCDSEDVLKMKYEELFLFPMDNFPKIYKHFSLPFPNNIEAVIKKPSSTTKQGSNILTEPKLQLETWKKHLNEEQASRVRAILSKFGFSHIEDVDYSLKMDRKIKL